MPDVNRQILDMLSARVDCCTRLLYLIDAFRGQDLRETFLAIDQNPTLISDQTLVNTDLAFLNDPNGLGAADKFLACRSALQQWFDMFHQVVTYKDSKGQDQTITVGQALVSFSRFKIGSNPSF
jgi:hypothetical protein